MSFFNFIILVTIFWIIFLFISLPLFLTPQNEVLKGNDRGAPEIHYFKEKIFVTFILAILVSLVFSYIFKQNF
ncbi:MAG: DUF1467 family protein [Rickettsiaceae bacterium]|nr:DUF1467 family protein [Rickettsiaceae bacterium]